MRLLLFIVALICASHTLFAQDYYWLGSETDNNWTTLENWSTDSTDHILPATLPNSTSNVYVKHSTNLVDTIIINDNISVGNLIIADKAIVILTESSVNLVDVQTLNITNVTGTFDLGTAQWSINGSNWTIEANQSFEIVAGNASITQTSNANFDFKGGNQIYGNLQLMADTTFIYGNNTFGKLSSTIGNLIELDTNTTTIFSEILALGNPMCGDYLTIRSPESTTATIFGTQPNNYLKHIQVIGIVADTVNAQSYFLQQGVDSLSSNFQSAGSKFYWIGNDGVFTDLANWSAISGGSPFNCLPTSADTIVFDNHSFSMAGQVALVDSSFTFASLQWENTTLPGTALQINDTKTLTISGDVVLQPTMQLLSENELSPASLIITNTSNLSLLCEKFDVNLEIDALIDTAEITLNTAFESANNRMITLRTGIFNTNGNTIITGQFYVDSTQTTFSRSVNLQSSEMTLTTGWMSLNTENFTLESGTSTVAISNEIGAQYLLTNGLNFHKVKIGYARTNLNDSTYIQLLGGSNTFKQLEIIRGTQLSVQVGTTQYIIDSLTILGNCIDSTLLNSSDSVGVRPIFNFSPNAVINVEAITINKVNATNQTNPLKYSRATTQNTGWNFSSMQPANVSLVDTITQICLADTYTFSYNATSNTGNTFTPNWNVGERINSPQYWVAYPIDTMQLLGHYDDSVIVDIISHTTYDTTYVYWPDSINPQDTTIYINANTTYTFVYETQWVPNYSIGLNTAIDTVYVPSLLDPSQIVAKQIFINEQRQTGYYLHVNIDFIDSVYTYNYKYPGEYLITIELIDDVTKCISRDSMNLRVIKPQFNSNSSIPDLTICAGTEVTVSSSTVKQNHTLLFDINGTNIPTTDLVLSTTIDTLSSPIDSITLEPIYITKYNAKYKTNSLNHNDIVYVYAMEDGCYSDTVKYQFIVNGLPQFTTGFDTISYEICENDILLVTSASEDPEVSFAVYKNTSFVGVGPSISVTNLVTNDVVSLIVAKDDKCHDTTKHTITVKPLPQTVFTAVDTTLNAICKGDPIEFIASGASIYNVYIADSLISTTIPNETIFTVSPPATYDEIKLVGIAANGCSFEAEEKYSYIVNQIPDINVATTNSLTICTGSPLQLSASGGEEYALYKDGALLQPLQGSPTFIDTIQADASYYVVGYASGCPDTSNIISFSTILSPSLNVQTGIINSSICSGDTLSIIATGASNYQFIVNNNAETPLSTQNEYHHVFMNGSSAEIIVIGEMNTCEVMEVINLSILPSPYVTILSSSTNNIICEGEEITFTGTGATSYELYLNNAIVGSSQTTNTFTPSLPVGTYPAYIIGEGTNGCRSKSISTLGVTVNPLPIVSASNNAIDNTLCSGTNLTVTASGADYYRFYLDGMAQGGLTTNNTFNTTTLLDGQTIYVQGSTLGCLSQTNPVSFTVNPNPVVSMVGTDIDNVFCEGTSSIYTASGAQEYQFFMGNTAVGSISAVNTFDATNLIAGNYLLKAVGYENGCSSQASIMVTVNPTPSATITSNNTSNIICSGTTVNYTATGGNLYEYFIDGVSQGPAVFNWLNTSNLQDGQIVSVRVSTAQGCSDVASMAPITVNPTPNLTITSSDSDLIFCVNDEIQFTADGANEYEFYINNISIGSPSSNPTFTSSSFSNGDILKVVGTSIGCTNTITLAPFTVHNYPVVNLINHGDTQICINEAIDLQATGATTYQFSINGNAIGQYSSTDVFTQAVSNGDVITVNGDLNGCISTAQNQITYTVYDYPTLNVLSTDADNVICKDELVIFTSTGAMEYVYTLNGTTIHQGANGIYQNETLETNDIITVTGFNGDCASLTETFQFTVNAMDLQFAANPSNMICTGDEVTFTATGADLYEFYKNGTSLGAAASTGTISLSGLQDNDQISFAGTSNSTGCTQHLGNYILMDVMSTPTIAVNGAVEFCEGDSVVLTSNSFYGNQWYFNGQLITGATQQNYVAYEHGTYTVEVTHGGDANLYSVGYNASGTFGTGNNFNNLTPQMLPNLAIREVKAGKNHVLAVTENGQLYTWGDNEFGQLGNGTYTDKNTPVLLNVQNVKTVATADNSSLAITNDGKVYVWGENQFGQLGTNNNGVINFTYLNNAITDADTAVGGKDHFVVLKNDGTVWTTGHNASGQLGNGTLTNSLSFIQVPNLTNIVAIGAGEYSSYAINNNGQLYVWGANTQGQLGLGDITHRLTPTLSPLKHVRSAQGGATHSIFTTVDHSAYATGGNEYGQLGLGDYQQRLTPTKIDLPGVRQVSTGQYHTIFNRLDNTVFACGDNANGQLSFDTIQQVTIPTRVAKMNGVTYVEAGRLTTHAIYGKQNTCESSQQQIIVHELPEPIIVVSENNLLSVPAGATAYQWYLDGIAIENATNNTYQTTTTGNYTVEVTHNFGCSILSQVTFVSFLGLDDLASITAVTYPNPTTGKFNIQLAGQFTDAEVHITVLDFMGRTVMIENQVLSALNTIDLSELPAGSYQVIIETSQQRMITKVIKINE